MIRPGDIAPRRDTDTDLYIAVLSNATHLHAATGRLIVCPFIPGSPPEDTGMLLPELVQWLPSSVLDAPIGNTGRTALYRAASIVGALADHS